ncbi:orotate phosphoribosyltransferase [Marinospirillum alkaliphilum]|uniref:Orotate phosphoribosyltransferase n=1 Tax=Marinospirillum alkaliphilum DSM 21637 TaxID=1122209 RepID=A0A1K1WMB5_9GAMM|nr:orotate phosphoribosyltransferase [Marinospirillum alkaliphilum]SFX38505.1 orotate phosphoribosyltransferase [Marinospirillum alkaliphilum DSM 21637]
MLNYQQDFIDFALQQQVLRFGQFKLKSGRVSPYFFNAGLFNSGEALVQLGKSYAQAIMASGLHFDVLFGPAYKGIPLASATASMLAEHHQRPTPFAFNRKEAKTHGEGGQLVGADLQGKKVLIIDDVITAGTAIREVLPMIEQAGGEVAGVVIALNRQERGKGERSAIQEVEQDLQIPVISIISLDNVLEFASNRPELQQHVGAIEDYRQTYGV